MNNTRFKPNRIAIITPPGVWWVGGECGGLVGEGGGLVELTKNWFQYCEDFKIVFVCGLGVYVSQHLWHSSINKKKRSPTKYMVSF